MTRLSQSGQPQQVAFDYSETTPKECLSCGCLYFIAAIKIGVVSMTHPRNPARKDLELPFKCNLCYKCGHEYGAKLTKQRTREQRY